MLLIWGIISFHRLPVEAYPDVADKYAWVITQWPGRAAEEVEQQVTIPIETQMNGVAAHDPPALRLPRGAFRSSPSSLTMKSDNLLNRNRCWNS